MWGINQLSPGTQHSTFAFDSQKIKKLRELYISLQNQWEVQTRFSDPLSQEWNTVKSRALIDATKDDIKLIIGQNTSAILNKVIETAPEYNKWKEEILKTFIDSHILSLNIEEDNYLLSNLYYFLRLVESYDFWWSELLDDIISEPEFFNKKTILYELLYNYVYLPDYEKSNQELFDLKC